MPCRPGGNWRKLSLIVGVLRAVGHVINNLVPGRTAVNPWLMELRPGIIVALAIK